MPIDNVSLANTGAAPTALERVPRQGLDPATTGSLSLLTGRPTDRNAAALSNVVNLNQQVPFRNGGQPIDGPSAAIDAFKPLPDGEADNKPAAAVGTAANPLNPANRFAIVGENAALALGGRNAAQDEKPATAPKVGTATNETKEADEDPNRAELDSLYTTTAPLQNDVQKAEDKKQEAVKAEERREAEKTDAAKQAEAAEDIKDADEKQSIVKLEDAKVAEDADMVKQAEADRLETSTMMAQTRQTEQQKMDDQKAMVDKEQMTTRMQTDAEAIDLQRQDNANTVRMDQQQADMADRMMDREMADQTETSRLMMMDDQRMMLNRMSVQDQMMTRQMMQDQQRMEDSRMADMMQNRVA